MVLTGAGGIENRRVSQNIWSVVSLYSLSPFVSLSKKRESDLTRDIESKLMTKTDELREPATIHIATNRGVCTLHEMHVIVLLLGIQLYCTGYTIVLYWVYNCIVLGIQFYAAAFSTCV